MLNASPEEFKTWLAELNDRPVYSTHEHHLEAERYENLNAEELLRLSYTNWCLHPPEGDPASRAAFLDNIRTNTYFHWLEKAVCRIYGYERWDERNWDEISEKINKAHRNRDWHIRLMEKHGGYLGFMEDAYWNSGSHLGYPDFVAPVYRLDPWIGGVLPEWKGHDGKEASDSSMEPSPDLDHYIERLRHELRSRRDGIVALKSAVAYSRTLAFSPPDMEIGRAAFKKNPAERTSAERDMIGDCVIQAALETAAELDLPVQWHTGLARLAGSNPMLMESLIVRHRGVRFVLFHGGFPWIYETASLAHQYGNVALDINWLPLISTSAAVQALHVYTDVIGRSDNIAWGGDSLAGEESVGAAIAFRHVLARVLAEKVAYTGWAVKDAERFADKIMFANAQSYYKLDRLSGTNGGPA